MTCAPELATCTNCGRDDCGLAGRVKPFPGYTTFCFSCCRHTFKRKRIRAYLSHPIRGAKGAAATHEDMEVNNRRAIKFAARVRAEFPSLDLYTPGEHDLFVVLAYEAGYITEEQILAVDKIILAQQNILIVYSPDGYIGGGVGVEITQAQRLKMPIVFTTGSLDPIHRMLEGMVR